MNTSQRAIPIFTSSGAIGAFIAYPYIYNPQGEWIGWLARNRQVYSINGNYVGWLNDDPRILRKKSTAHMKPRLTPPPPPGKISLPDIAFDPPKMANMKTGTFDVLENAPELMPPHNQAKQPNQHK